MTKCTCESGNWQDCKACRERIERHKTRDVDGEPLGEAKCETCGGRCFFEDY